MSRKSRAKAARGAPPVPGAPPVRVGAALAAGIIVLAAFAAYHNSFSGPFILDDHWAIADNPSIRSLRSALSPPNEASTAGRPLLNLTFAVNYALGGMDVRGYHSVNLLIHALAGLTLYGVFRRTLLRPPLAGRFGPDAAPLALAAAVLWTVDPLQTEAVTYISQRAEALCGLFYLLTLYGFVRSTESAAPARWRLLSVGACLLAVLAKEIIVTAPVVVLLYDRIFVGGSFSEALRRRWRYYLGLASVWLLLAIRLRPGLQQQAVGFDQGVTAWNYALTSSRSVAMYLKLSVWPHPLVFDYGAEILRRAGEALPYALPVGALLAATVFALRRWPAVGFAGAWFFLILAPTSSVVPIAGQPTAEHRVYLSLAAVVGAFVLLLYAWIGKRSLAVCAALATGLGWLTVERNEDYRSLLAIWSDTVAKCPSNGRAHTELGNTLKGLGSLPEAISEYEEALRIKPDYAEALNNLGAVIATIPGRLPEAISHYEAALRANPSYPDAHYNLGMAFSRIPGRSAEAIEQYEEAVRIRPDYSEAQNNLGSAIAGIPGRMPEAIAHFERAVQADPDNAEAQCNLGLALATVPGRMPEAIAHFEAALRANPNKWSAHYDLAIALLETPGRTEEAEAHLVTALRINPGFQPARDALARLRAGTR